MVTSVYDCDLAQVHGGAYRGITWFNAVEVNLVLAICRREMSEPADCQPDDLACHSKQKSFQTIPNKDVVADGTTSVVRRQPRATLVLGHISLTTTVSNTTHPVKNTSIQRAVP